MFGVRKFLKKVIKNTSPKVDAVKPSLKPDNAPPVNSSFGKIRLASIDQIKAAQSNGPILVNHWASWCDGCVVELPLLIELQGKFPELTFLGISWDLFMVKGPIPEVLKDLDGISDYYGITWDTLVFSGKPEELFEGLELSTQTIPQTHLFSQKGVLIRSWEYPIEKQDIVEIENEINKMM